jgi:hypothetical protein
MILADFFAVIHDGGSGLHPRMRFETTHGVADADA